MAVPPEDVLANPGQVVVRLLSEPRVMVIVRAAVREMAILVGFSSDEANQVVLAVDEALTNVIKHAYDSATDRPIEVAMGSTGDPTGRAGIRVAIRDYGKQVDPREIRGRDLDELRAGGLGIHLIRAVMDRVEYTPMPEGGTVLLLEKSADGGADGNETATEKT